MDTINEEELKEQLAEEMAKYEEEGYFKRLIKMFSGRPIAITIFAITVVMLIFSAVGEIRGTKHADD